MPQWVAQASCMVQNAHLSTKKMLCQLTLKNITKDTVLLLLNITKNFLFRGQFCPHLMNNQNRNYKNVFSIYCEKYKMMNIHCTVNKQNIAKLDNFTFKPNIKTRRLYINAAIQTAKLKCTSSQHRAVLLKTNRCQPMSCWE